MFTLTFGGVFTWMQVAAFWSCAISLSTSLLLAFSASASTASAFSLSKWAASCAKIIKTKTNSILYKLILEGIFFGQ